MMLLFEVVCFWVTIELVSSFERLCRLESRDKYLKLFNVEEVLDKNEVHRGLNDSMMTPLFTTFWYRSSTDELRSYSTSFVGKMNTTCLFSGSRLF